MSEFTEYNKSKIEKGTKLIYNNLIEYQYWIVRRVLHNGFEAMDNDGFEEFFMFSEINDKKWSIAN